MAATTTTLSRLAAFLLLAGTLVGCAGVDYSPDGKQLAFTWPLGNDSRLAVINVDGGGFKYVSSTATMIPNWAPDSRRIAFANNEGVAVLDTQTGKSQLVVPDGGPIVAWGPDGRKLATFAKGEPGTDVVWYDFDAKAITLRAKVPGLEKAEDVMPDLVWIPRNSGLAFVASVDKAADVYLMEAGEVKKITTTGDVVGLALDPGGQRLVWARHSRNPKYILLTLYSFDLVNRSAQRLPFPERVPGINPDPRTGPAEVAWVSFSPTLERMLVWTSADAPQPPAPRPDDLVYTVNRAGTESAIVGRSPHGGGKEAITHIAWSPDGSQMAGLWTGKDTARLETRNADGTGARTLRSYRGLGGR
ncbi:MAG: hypothetical protein M9921_12945 [Fimbriimonadaceae bacterium]|nr:hypothetical protein [Fimbriimonadaceae bacterium]